MDNSRQFRLASYRREMRDYSLPSSTRKRAAFSYYRVKRQMKDKHLAKLRYQYMRADAVGDRLWRENIGDKVSEYMYRVYKRII